MNNDLMNRQLKTTEDDEIDALIEKANNAGIRCTREMIEELRRRFEEPIVHINLMVIKKME